MPSWKLSRHAYFHCTKEIICNSLRLLKKSDFTKIKNGYILHYNQETKNKETEYELCQIIKNLKYRTNCLITHSQERWLSIHRKKNWHKKEGKQLSMNKQAHPLCEQLQQWKRRWPLKHWRKNKDSVYGYASPCNVNVWRSA